MHVSVFQSTHVRHFVCDGFGDGWHVELVFRVWQLDIRNVAVVVGIATSPVATPILESDDSFLGVFWLQFIFCNSCDQLP